VGPVLRQLKTGAMEEMVRAIQQLPEGQHSLIDSKRLSALGTFWAIFATYARPLGRRYRSCGQNVAKPAARQQT
jgi:hypothetical protein